MAREIDFTIACGAIFTLVYTSDDFIGSTTPSCTILVYTLILKDFNFDIGIIHIF